MADPQITKNEDENRYELMLDGERIGLIDFEREDEQVVALTHTEVDKAHGGQGYGAQLADFALRDIRDSGLLVRPVCPFIAKHIERNAEFGTILAAD